MQDHRSYLVQSLMNEWQINNREDSLSLLEALLLRVPAAPRAFLRQACKKKRILVNTIAADTDQTVYVGDLITIRTSARFKECLEQSHIDPDQILYEDRDCIVLNKPPGLAIHKALGHSDNLLLRLSRFLKLRGETFQVSPVHRLDLGTSGAVLFGKGRAAISQLGRSITDGLFDKRYKALVSGRITEPGQLVTPVPAKGKIKEAKTSFQPVALSETYSLLELELETGRQHQIRHQLAAAARPIVGDKRYHGETIDGLKRPFLHCHHLSFPHPQTKKVISVDCPLAEDLCLALRSLGLPEWCKQEKTE